MQTHCSGCGIVPYHVLQYFQQTFGAAFTSVTVTVFIHHKLHLRFCCFISVENEAAPMTAPSRTAQRIRARSRDLLWFWRQQRIALNASLKVLWRPYGGTTARY